MGQQVYEREIRSALLALSVPNLEFRDVRVSSMRTTLPGARRSPSRAAQKAPWSVSRIVGGSVYRTMGLVHRLDLRLPVAPGREVLTIHDLPGLRFDDEGPVPRSASRSAARARIIICPSKFAADEVRTLLGARRIEVVPYGVSRTFSTEGQRPLMRADMTDAPPFVLHAAGATKRKNLVELARAWALLERRFTRLVLVLCGPPDPRRNAAFGGLARVELRGRVEPGEVAALMRRAAVVVVPSVYEGFGLPALEAMASGAPVVAARAGALPEVCDSAALLVEPTGEALADGIARVLAEPGLAGELSAAGTARAAAFSWDVAAHAHIAAYEAALR
jgi:glycosyltransferase involved in cell wall biosynthesis